MSDMPLCAKGSVRPLSGDNPSMARLTARAAVVAVVFALAGVGCNDDGEQPSPVDVSEPAEVGGAFIEGVVEGRVEICSLMSGNMKAFFSTVTRTSQCEEAIEAAQEARVEIFHVADPRVVLGGIERAELKKGIARDAPL